MTAIKDRLLKNKSTLFYSCGLAIALFLLKWLDIRFILFDLSFEIYIGIIAVVFTALGIWLALKLTRPKTQNVFIVKEVYLDKPEIFELNLALVNELGISQRELEILNLLAQGCSNQEIAEELCVSLSTVKTHNQNIFEKLEVKRRTQAVEKAKRLNIIP